MASTTRHRNEPTLEELQARYAAGARPWWRKPAGLAGLLVAAAVAVGVVLLLTMGTAKPSAPTATPGRPASPVAGSSPPAVAPSSPAAPPSPGSDADMTTMQLNGITLPVSRMAGPHMTANGLASGFAETPLGAALAALHIGARLDPTAGAAIFTPTAKNQTLGDSSALVQELQAATPATGAVAQYVGYRIDGYSTVEAVTVHLEATQPGTAAQYDVPINVEWVSGDWKVVLPLTSQVEPVTAPSSYIAF